MSHTISGVEVFRSGKWNGDTYNIADLDAMIAAFRDTDLAIPIKLGHTKEPGTPAYGWVSSLKRVGDKLIADFSDVPAAIYAKIKERAYDRISAEVWLNATRDGKKFPAMLSAVALLGAEVPAVAGLAPLRTVVNSELGDIKSLCTFTLRTEGNMPTRQMTDEPVVRVHQFGLDIDRRVREIRMESGCTYAQALDRIRNFEPELYRAYAEEATR